MNKQPKIFAHCPAGCKWETVHKSEFLKSASWVIPDIVTSPTEIYTTLNLRHTYKITRRQDATDWGVRIWIAPKELKDQGHFFTETDITDLPAYDEFTEFFKFRPLKAEFASDGNANIWFEVNGVRFKKVMAIPYTDITTGDRGVYTSGELLFCFSSPIDSDTSIMIWNEDGTIAAFGEDGKSFKTVADFTIDPSEWVSLADCYPFAYRATKTLVPTIKLAEDSEVMVSFGDMIKSAGVALYSVEGTTELTAVFYAIAKPTTSVGGNIGAVV